MHWIKKHKEVVVLTIFTIFFTLIALKSPAMLGHDTNFHLANIENLKQSITLANPLPLDKIVPNLSHGMGYGIYLFYPMMPHLIVAYFAKLLQLFSMGTDTALFLFYILSSVVSTIFIYIVSNKLFQKKSLAIFSAIVFLCMPYRIGTMTVRGALNETLIYLFLPMLILSFLYLKEKRWNLFYIFFISGWVGMIWSHLVMALYTALLFLPILLFLWNHRNEKEMIKHVTYATVLVSIIVLPGIITTFCQDGYLVFKEDYVTRIGLLKENTLGIQDYLIPKSNYDWDVPFFLPVVTILSLLYSLIQFFKNKKKDPFWITLWIELCLLFFFMSPYFTWEGCKNTLGMIQFPWRLLSIVAIISSILIPLGFQTQKKNVVPFISICLVFSMIPFLASLQNRPYEHGAIDLENGRGNILEYYPEEYLEYPSFFEIENNQIDILEGTGKVKVQSIAPHDIKFSINTKKTLILELPKIYYNGYRVKDEKGNMTMPSKSKHGLIEVEISKSGSYQLYYKDPAIVTFFKWVRAFGIIITLWIGTSKKIKFKI